MSRNNQVAGYEVIEHEFTDAPAALLAMIQTWIREQRLSQAPSQLNGATL